MKTLTAIRRAVVLVALFVVALSFPVDGQVTNPGVQQSGSIKAGNCAAWVSAGRIKDSGGTCGGSGGVTSVQIDPGTGIDVSGTCTITTTGTCAVALENTAVTPATYGSATSCPTIAIDQQGRITTASATTCTPAFASVTGQATLAQLPTIANVTLLSNITGAGTVPAANTLTQFLDVAACNTNGQFLGRAGGVWDCVSGGGGSSPNMFNVLDYATCDGVTDDTAGFQSLAAAVKAAGAGIIEFPPAETCIVFPSPAVGTQALMDLDGTNGVTINFRGSTLDFTGTFTGGRVVRVISLNASSNITINGYRAIQSTTTSPSATDGLQGIYVVGASYYITINGAYQHYGRSIFECVPASSTTGWTQGHSVTINGMTADTVFYGIAFQRNCNLTTITGYRAINNARALDFYNVKQVNVDMASEPGSNCVGDLLFGVYTNNTHTALENTLSDVNVTYRSTTQTASCTTFTGTFIQQQTATTASGHINNVTLKLDINIGTAANTSVAWELYKQANGGGADSTTRNHTVRNVTITGTLLNWGNSVNVINVGQFGVWTGEVVHNTAFENIMSTGAAGVWAINTIGFNVTKFVNVSAAQNLTWTNNSGYIFFDWSTRFGNQSSYSQLYQPLTPPYPSNMIGGYAKAVNLNSANTDTAIQIVSPTTNYRLHQVFVYNNGTTASITTATGGLFTATGGGGIALCANGALSALTANTINTDNAAATITCVAGARTPLNVTTLYFRVGTAQGAAATADVYLFIQPMP